MTIDTFRVTAQSPGLINMLNYFICFFAGSQKY